MSSPSQQASHIELRPVANQRHRARCDGRSLSAQIIVPLMLTVFFAKLVGDALSYSIYDTHIKIRGAPVLVRPHMAPTISAYTS